MKKILLMSTLYLGLTTAAFADQCTKASLDKLRAGEFTTKYKAGAFEEAAKLLDSYMDKADCYSTLVYEATKNNPQDAALSKTVADQLKSYLWARNDIALAYLKAGKSGDCIQITDTELNQFYVNPLNMLEDQKLTDAFNHNLDQCQKLRDQSYPQNSKPSDCDSAFKGLRVNRSFVGEDKPIKIPVPIKSVVSAFTPEVASGFACVGVVKIEAPRGLFTTMCSSIEECKKTGEESDNEPVETALLVGVKPGETKLAEEIALQSETDFMDRCGDFTFTQNKNDKNQEVFRFKGGFSPCGGGTARGEADEIVALQDGKATVVDSATRMFH